MTSQDLDEFVLERKATTDVKIWAVGLQQESVFELHFLALCFTSNDTEKEAKKPCEINNPGGEGRFQLLTQQCSAHQLKARTQPLTRFASGWTISPARRGARTTGHGRTTGPSVSPVIWATVQPGRNHGKGPGKRWVYCPSILPPVTDAHCLTRGLVFWIFWEHPQIPKYSVTLLEQHKRKWDCVSTYQLVTQPDKFMLSLNNWCLFNIFSMIN